MNSFRYNVTGSVLSVLKNETILWNEFKSLKLYDRYLFGMNDRPLLYLYGTHYTGNRFFLFESPDQDDGLIVFIKIPKGNLKKLRENEKEFFDKY